MMRYTWQTSPKNNYYAFIVASTLSISKLKFIIVEDISIFWSWVYFFIWLTKMSSSLDNLTIYHLYYCESSRKMSNAFKWFLIRLYDRYYDTVINYQGLIREVSNFPYYSTKISKRFNKERFLINNNIGERYDFEDYELMDESKCRISMLIYGSVTKTRTLGTGTNGNYHESMRKGHAYIKHRSIYSGYKITRIIIAHDIYAYIHTLHVWSMLYATIWFRYGSDVKRRSILFDVQTNRPFD